MKSFKKILSLAITALMIATIIPSFQRTSAAETISGNGRLLVGYWHNFDNGAGIVKIRDVDPSWDIINVSFGETYTDRAWIELHPCYDEKEFIEDIKYVQSKGKKVVLSLGGAEGTIQIYTDEARQKFMTSLTGLIDKYGFDGIDIDLEGGSGMILQGGDTDFKNPKTPQIVNFIKVIKDLVAMYGDPFIISMAPELSYVQGGITAYAGNWGAYLPLIHAVRDELDFLQVQHYNCGGNMSLDGTTYKQGTADFQVAMVDMLLQGFTIADGKQSFFPPLKQEQVVIGVPASQKGTFFPDSGYIPPAEMLKALNYIVHGQSYGGQYKMVGEKYPNLRGIMAWSINWDNVNNKEFVKSYRPFFNSLSPIGPVGPVEPTLKAPKVSASEVKNKSYDITVNIPKNNLAVSYELYENGKLVKSKNLTENNSSDINDVTQFTNKGDGVYTYNAVVKDRNGNTKTSSNVIVEVTDVVSWGNPDINTDGKVDVVDLSLVAVSYNAKSSDSNYNGKVDLNSNGIVDIYDLVRVAKNMGETPPDPDPDPTAPAWKVGTSYKLGDKVTYNNKVYECTLPHTAIEGWEPGGASAALWKAL
ncbi:MAG: carbohydrate-binding protein [Clostridium sp.]